MNTATLDELHGGAAEAYLPLRLTATSLHDALQDCRGCPLWERATQAVPGDGRKSSRVMLVGEQPGDHEDVSGRPFVGPAGRLLDEALEESGIDRETAFVTNAVKHFKWEPRGKRRLHQKPNRSEVDACGPWLAGEIEYVRPDFLVLLGSTAAQSILGSDVRVTRIRGEVLTDTPLARHVMATVHPSAVLRTRDGARREAMAAFVEDLRRVGRVLRAS